MNRIFNFSAGPCTLPVPALQSAAGEFLEYKGKGMSLIEMSHRSKEYDAVHREAADLVRRLYELPDSYKVLFLGGGASLQFSMVPMNLMEPGGRCDLALTGAWSKKALADARKIGTVNLAYDGTDENFMDLPDPATLRPGAGSAYFHLTSNETIGGVQWQRFPATGSVPLVCDMSSDFVSRPLDVSQFGLIYAGAQKNAGPAGAAIVIIREDLLERSGDHLTSYLNYATHAAKDSMYNTPPVFAVYMIMKTLQWLEGLGGLEAAERMAKERSGLIYGAMAKSAGFYSCPVKEHCRSVMNVVFRLPDEELEKKFVAEALENGMSGLKGHRSVGGCRASIYNAMPVAGARTLAEFMNDFASRN
ncbi:MAG: 3-phosphoserine/phosphohydroxythreonine transaminase [Acidobacteria bacterium]|uniref:Phosphoserine aminotransferase n=1 Tax=Candidatus Polarisedimenticola svalbardensis TaxID=2886004 RepID=A0A8J6XXA9_9BACT|nr:3-phosphoserine/phosphohydroxythreonine transaminase [Candidatus Polarisedimenticola svalbardensis]